MADDTQRWAAVALELQRQQATTDEKWTQFMQDWNRAKQDPEFASTLAERAQFGRTQTGKMGFGLDAALLGMGFIPHPVPKAISALGFAAAGAARGAEEHVEVAVAVQVAQRRRGRGVRAVERRRGSRQARDR